MRAKYGLFCLVLGVWLLGGCSHRAAEIPPEKQPVNFVNAKYDMHLTNVSQVDPAYLFIYANDLFLNGQKDEAFFWFLVAQYRGQVVSALENKKGRLPAALYQHLAAEIDTPLLGRMEVLGRGLNRKHLYDLLQEGMGAVLHPYASGRPKLLRAQLEKAHAFEQAHPFDPFQAVPANQLDGSRGQKAMQQARQNYILLTHELQQTSPGASTPLKP